MEGFTVIRPFRWGGKNLKRDDEIIPQNANQAIRLKQLMKTGWVAPNLDPTEAEILEASDARYIRVKEKKVKKNAKN